MRSVASPAALAALAAATTLAPACARVEAPIVSADRGH